MAATKKTAAEKKALAEPTFKVSNAELISGVVGITELGEPYGANVERQAKEFIESAKAASYFPQDLYIDKENGVVAIRNCDGYLYGVKIVDLEAIVKAAKA